MKTFEIYFADLNEKAQKEYLEFCGLQNASEGNFDLLPIASVDIQVDDDEGPFD